MKKVIIAAIVFQHLLILGCKKDNSTIENNDIKAQLKSAQIVESSNKFCFDLIKEYNQTAPEKNLFISPFSAMEALSMAYNGANGETKTEMANILGFQGYTDENINEYNKSLNVALTVADEKVKFEIANSVWCREGFSILQTFLDVNRSNFDAEVRVLDFSKPEATKTINNWVKTKTHEKIPEIIDEIPAEAMLYIINAIYFKGSWKFKFDSTKTVKADFYMADAIVKHDQISMEAEINYYENQDIQAVELPYGDGTFNFVMLLPKSKTITSLLSGLGSKEWKSIMGAMGNQRVVVKMPRFKFEMKTLMNQPLINLGMPSAFDPASADFSRIDGKRDLFISRVIHKTYIDLNEEGTEAAAVTAIEIELTSAGGNNDNRKYFIGDRPFIYAITEKSTGAVLFIGIMMNPTITNLEF